MQTKVKVKQRDSSGYRVKPLSIVEQMEVDELVSLFLSADLAKRNEILNSLRKHE